MQHRIARHITRCALAGTIALLPIVGLLLTVTWMEGTLAESWLARQAWYVPGLGIVVAAAAVYLIGLCVSTVIGRWALTRVDGALQGVPALGRMYATFKQIAGYDTTGHALFRGVVLIPSPHAGGEEYALVTAEAEAAGTRRLTLFVPGAPNPTTGRVVLIDAARTRPAGISVSDALSLLLAVGATNPGADRIEGPAAR